MDMQRIAKDVRSIKIMLFLMLVIAIANFALFGYAYFAENNSCDVSSNTDPRLSLWYSEAENLSNNNEWDSLLKLAKDWMNENPDDAYANWFNAVALYKLKKYSEAINSFERAKMIAPSWSDNINNYIEICNDQISGGKEVIPDDNPKASNH